MFNPLPPAKVAALMVLAMLLITINDNFVKLLSAELPASQIMVTRGLFALSLFASLIRFVGMPILPREALGRMNLKRGCLEAISSGCIVISLGLIPISIVSMLSWSAPIFATILAALVLHERVGWIRWLSVCVGFVGVFLITNPTSTAFNLIYLLPIVCAISIALRDVVTRRISTALHPYYITLITTLCVTICGLLIAVISGFDGWQGLSLRLIAMLFITAALITSAFLLMIICVQNGELSFIAPFSFSGAIFGVLAGVIFWGERLTPLTLLGTLLISAAALIILIRQRALASD